MIVDLGQLTGREREVVLAAVDGVSTQVVAERLFISPRTVEHHLSAAYRKLGVRSRSALIALFREEPPVPAPVTRYAVSGDAHIAYQVAGEGDQDIVLIPGFISNVETAWSWPAHARFLRLLTAGRRLIVFDKRGTGLSDPVHDPSRLTLEQRMDEVRAVMDAAGSRRATLFGFSEGAALSMLFAATYPSRTSGLILYGALISGLLDPETSGTAGVFKDPAGAWEIMRQAWGTGQFLAPFGPSAACLESGIAHIARFERHGASPAAAYAIIRMAGAIEVRGLCAAVHTPCLVMHRRDDQLVPVANSRYLAGHLPAARYVELAGRDHPPWLGDNELLLSEVDRFLSADHPAQPGGTRLLQTVVIASEPLSPAELAVVERFRGRPAASRHGLLYTFEGPVRAVECAVAVAQLRGSLRFGVHAGEIELRPGGAGGAVPAIAAAVLEAAGPGEVAVTGVVKDLTLGADLEFTAAQELRLADGERLALYRARTSDNLCHQAISVADAAVATGGPRMAGDSNGQVFDRLPDSTWIYPGTATTPPWAQRARTSKSGVPAAGSSICCPSTGDTGVVTGFGEVPDCAQGRLPAVLLLAVRYPPKTAPTFGPRYLRRRPQHDLPRDYPFRAWMMMAARSAERLWPRLKPRSSISAAAAVASARSASVAVVIR